MIPRAPARGPGLIGHLFDSGWSALGVLRRLAGPLEAVLLALLRPRVAGQEAGLAKRAARIRMGGQQRAGDAMADGAGLAGDPATGDEHAGRVAAHGLGHPEREEDGALRRRTAEVLGGGLAVDDDAPVAGKQTDPRDGGLAPAGPVDVVGAHRSRFTTARSWSVAGPGPGARRPCRPSAS